MTFQDKVKIHMSQYTTSEINDEVKGGEFRGKRYSHIFDKEKDADNEKLNIFTNIGAHIARKNYIYSGLIKYQNIWNRIIRTAIYKRFLTDI